MSADVSYGEFLRARREDVMGRIEAACQCAGREPGEVQDAWRAGWRAFGENRPQELVRKTEALGGLPEMAGVRFDMIGNLQKNKINQVIGRAALIHSVSSEHLAEAVSTRCEARGVVADVLLEVNVSGEASKSGFSPDELRAAVDSVVALPGISVQGLMTMAPAGDADAARRTFSGLRELACELRGRTGLALQTLSCGMSDDFEIAVEEGSTLVRLGRCVFDQGYALS